MRRARTVLVAAVSVLAAGAIAWGVYTESREARAQEILSAIETAEEKIPYTGLRQLVGPETVELRLWSMEGVKRVEFVGITGGTKPSRLPALPRVPFASGFPAFLKPGQSAWKKRIKDYDLAVKNYDVRVAGRDVVAGRACEVVEVVARHPGRASYRVAADLENRFPLRFEVLAGGERLFEARFKEIEYHPAFPPKTFQEPKLPQWLKVTPEAVPLEGLPSRAGFPVWLPAWTPPGFRPLASELVRVKLDLPAPAREAMRRFLPLGAPKLDEPVAHVDWTDGIAVISVVECAADSDLWAIARKFMPGYRPQKSVDGKATAVKISDRLGAAYIVELGGTVALVAGTVAAEDLETMIRTFERR